jgi:osmotically inducible lipoprotein OsmB
MRKIMMVIAAGALTFSMAACNTSGERAGGGAVIGGLAGAAIVGAATAPRSPCPRGTFRDARGNLYCR